MIAAGQGGNFERISALEALRPFPPVACALIELINQEATDFREVSRLLLADAAFSSQLLRVANSALLGCRYQIKSILQALSVVGVDRLRALVVTVALKQYLDEAGHGLLHRSWRHNLATALWCEALAEYCNVDRALGYTAGILHDIGRIALLMLFPQEYEAFWAASREGGPCTLETERQCCQTDHCRVGQDLSIQWNFPPLLRDVIAHHHARITPETPRLRLLVQAACKAASMSGFACVGEPRSWAPDQISAMLPRRQDVFHSQCEWLMETVAWKLNETECGLMVEMA